MFASRNSSHSSRVETDPLLSELVVAFREAAKMLASDPLMHCFKNSPESQAFMLDRIEEVVKGSVQAAAVQKLHVASQTIEELNKQLQALDRRLADTKRSPREAPKDTRDPGLWAEKLAGLESTVEIKKVEAGKSRLQRKSRNRVAEGPRERAEGDGCPSDRRTST